MIAPDFMVVSPLPTAAGERFYVVRRDALMAASLVWPSVDKLKQNFDRFLETLEAFTEDGIRAELEDMGLGPDEIERQVQRARRVRELDQSDTTWERTSGIGFRNVHSQEVIRKTEMMGPLDFERVYILRCTVCGHEHRCAGGEIHRSRCPHCQ